MSYQILECDVIAGLRELPDESVQCVVTSPPYWGLRDYGVDGQIGLEATPQEFLAKMVAVFREVRRVLRKDGICWVNLGDSYNAQPAQRKITDKAGPKQSSNDGSIGAPSRSVAGLKPKDLVGIPWRVAFHLQDDGWWLRQDIIWAKPNPMPESVTDRCTRAHEYVFMLTKSARYYYDANAIRTKYKRRDTYKKKPTGWADSGSHTSVAHATEKVQGRNKQRGHSRRHDGFNDRWDAMDKDQQQVNGANKRSVWNIATQGYPEAHFATFPEALVEPCILAGSKPCDTVLDPFSGSGTTGVVALRYQREYIGIELNPEYAAMSRKRIEASAPLFNAGVLA